MNPWKTLKIQPTDDKKAIKKAYAALIKQYKPDENPEKFQEIQEAYKYALSLGFLNKESSFDTVELIEKDSSTASNEEMKLAKELISKINLVAHSNPVQSLKISNWRFVEKYSNIDDLLLRKQTAQKAFEVVANINLDCLKSDKPLLIPMKIIKYLNKAFDWNNYWQEYKLIFTEPETNMIFSQSDTDEQAYKIGKIGFEGRLKCLYTDLYSSMLIAYVWMLFGEYGSFGFQFIKHTFLIFTIQRFIFEFIFKNSLGKAGNDAFIANINGQDVSRMQILFKHLIINFTFFPLYAWLFDRFLNDNIFIFNEYLAYNIWMPVFGFLIFLNLLTLVIYKRFLHEVLTRTVIIHKEPEEKPMFESL